MNKGPYVRVGAGAAALANEVQQGEIRTLHFKARVVRKPESSVSINKKESEIQFHTTWWT